MFLKSIGKRANRLEKIKKVLNDMNIPFEEGDWQSIDRDCERNKLNQKENMTEEKEKILYTKKTITKDTNDPEIEWVELDVYNFLEDQNSEDKTIH